MAATLGIQILQRALEVTDTVYKISNITPQHPILGIILQHAKEPWVKPALVPVSSHFLDHMYRSWQTRAEFPLCPSQTELFCGVLCFETDETQFDAK